MADPILLRKYVYARSEQGSYSRITPRGIQGYYWYQLYDHSDADVLLMAAEAEIETGGLKKAREYVNLIRTRAINSKLKRGGGGGGGGNGYDGRQVCGKHDTAPWTDAAVARTAVRMKELLELGM